MPALLNSAALVRPSADAPRSTIHFAGMGGSTEGALRAGLRPTVAVNHAKSVIASHQRNYPTVATDCSDLAQVHPSRYVSTEIYQASPACTAHSAAAGARRKQRSAQQSLFLADNRAVDENVEYAERSRATMFCVVDHAEYHRYPIVLVENVVDSANWVLFPSFLDAMRRLGYRQQRLVSLNAAFIGGTPQDRNRLHMVFALDSVEAPNMDLQPPAPCPTCQRDVPAVQSWKPGCSMSEYAIVGEYGMQYVYRCLACRTPVVPYYRAALNVIDPTVEAPTLREILAEKAKQGKTFDTMLHRIQQGIDQFGGLVPMLLQNNCTTHHGRTRSLFDTAFTQTGSNTTAVLLPPLDCGEAALPEARWVDAMTPRTFKTGIRGAIRTPSAIIDPARERFARQLMAGAQAAQHDLLAWRYRTLTPPERLLVQDFAPTHFVAGTHKQVHLAIGNANPPSVEAELAARAGAALRPDLYPTAIHPAARAA